MFGDTGLVLFTFLCAIYIIYKIYMSMFSFPTVCVNCVLLLSSVHAYMAAYLYYIALYANIINILRCLIRYQDSKIPIKMPATDHIFPQCFVN